MEPKCESSGLRGGLRAAKDMIFWWLLCVGVAITTGLTSPEWSDGATILDRLMLRYSSYKDDFPSSTGMSRSLTQALDAEEEILDVLNTYVNSGSLRKEATEFVGANNDGEGNQLLHLYHDVVFLGFPLTAIDFIADKWIHLLQRDEHILSTINDNDNVIKMPGDIMIRNHYNLVKSSFHVADAINSRIKSMRSSNSTINIWEIEEILQSLSDAIFTTSVQKDDNNENEIHAQAPPAAVGGTVQPTSVIYILNLSNTRGLKYYYGFTDEELLEIRDKHQDLRDLSTQILQNEKRRTRLDLDRDESKPPLQGLQLDDVGEAYSDSSADEGNSGYVKDSLKGTRNWATKFNSEPFSSSIYNRAQRILQSAANPHRLHLAKAILNTNDMSLPSRTHCSSDTWVSSSNRLMWIDLNSAKTPPINILDGITLSTPTPRQLDDSEWLKLGELSLTSKLGARDSDNVKLLSTNIVSLQNTVVRYKENVESFLRQTKNCAVSASVLQGDFTHVVREVGKLYELKEISLTCGSLFLQAIFFEKILQPSSLFHSVLTSPVSEGDGDEEYHLRELSLLHIDLLTYAIERSNLFHESLVHGNHISQEAGMYLGHLASKVLHLTRYIITPPMQLQYSDTMRSRSVPSDGLKSQRTFYEIIDGLHLYESENPNMYHNFIINENNLWLNNIMPGNLVPNRVEFAIYVIRVQNSYDPVDKNGLNYWHLMKEISKLKLPNQQMVVSTVSINSVNEEGLGIGLSLCQRSEVISRSNEDMTSTYYEYLDSSCMWTYLQHHDEVKSKHNEDFYKYNQYIPIFIVSVDTVTPTYVDGTSAAVSVNGGIIAVQNMHEHIGTTMLCDGHLLHINGRNPLAPILTAVGGIVGGLGKSHSGHCGVPTSYTVADAMDMKYVEYGNKEKWSSRASAFSLGSSMAIASMTDLSIDYSSFLGDSPVFDINSVSSLPSFSPLDVDFIHRSKIIKSLSITTAIVKYDSAAGAREAINVQVQNALQALRHFDYAAAAAYSNLAHSLIVPMAALTSAVSSESSAGYEKQQEHAARKITVTDRGFLLHYFIFPAIIMLLFFFVTVILVRRVLSVVSAAKHTKSSSSSSLEKKSVDGRTEESVFKLNLPAVFGKRADSLPSHY